MSFLNGYFEEVHFRGVLPKVLYNDKQKMLIFVWHSGGGFGRMAREKVLFIAQCLGNSALEYLEEKEKRNKHLFDFYMPGTN